MPTRARYTRPREAEGERYQRTTLRIARLHLPTTQLHPGLTILQGERETFFFLLLQTVYITRRHFDPLEYGRLGSFNTAIHKRRGLVLPAIAPFCADWITLLPEKINGSFEQFHVQHLARTASSQNGALRTLLALRERERETGKKNRSRYMFFLPILWRYDDQHILVCSLPQIEQRLFRTLATLWDWLSCAKEPNGHTVDPKTMHAMTVLLGGLVKKS